MAKSKLDGATSKLDETLSLFPQKEEKKKVGFIKDNKESKFSITSFNLHEMEFRILDDIKERANRESMRQLSRSEILRALIHNSKNIKEEQVLKNLREISI